MLVTVVGAGSTYTPELVTGFHHVREWLGVDELVLMDIDADRLENVGAFAERILHKYDLPITVRTTTDLDDAVTGADAVLVQIRVGGQAMRLQDETIPLRHNQIGQETTGAGGAMKALRTVPVVLDIARRVAERASENAWLVDFTNPVGIVSRALLENGHRAVGLCNYAIGMQRWAAQTLGVEPHRVEVDPTGLNHFSWTRSIRLDGQEVLPQILAEHTQAVIDRFGFSKDLIDLVGAIPSYYLKWYYHNARRLEELRTETPRATEVANVEAVLLEMYRNPALVERPVELEQRGGAYYSEAAAELLASLVGTRPGRHVVNVQNQGLYAGLADDDVVETLCEVDHAGPRPVEQAPMPPYMLGPAQHVLAYERQISTAAQTGDIKDVERALLTHPLIGDIDCIDAMLPELMDASASYLPQFGQRG